MEKKDLKFYEAPAFEVVELEIESMLCASPEVPAGGGSQDIPADGIDPGFFE